MKINEIIDSPFKQQGILLKNSLEEVSALCSEFLKVYKKVGPMYHGFKSAPSNVFVGRPHPDRKPLTLSYDEQYVIDKRLSSAGFVALRGNSLFCTGDAMQASFYGLVYQIFPKNGFRYTWSDFSDMVSDSRFNTIQAEKDYIIPDDFVERFEFTDHNLDLALQTDKEIYLCGEFIAVANLLLNQHQNTYLQWANNL